MLFRLANLAYQYIEVVKLKYASHLCYPPLKLVVVGPDDVIPSIGLIGTNFIDCLDDAVW